MRDTSMDVDDPDASLTDPEWHKSFIYANSYSSSLKHIVKVKDDGLVFSQGIFNSSALRMLMKPTMKGFWVPVTVQHGARLVLGSDQQPVIGLGNCAAHVGGSVTLNSKSIRSFELIPITDIFALDITRCDNLTDLKKLPNVVSELHLNYQQLKLNLKHVFMACKPSCNIRLSAGGGHSENSVHARSLEHIINYNLMRKAGPSFSFKKGLLTLQTDLIDRDFDDYAEIL